MSHKALARLSFRSFQPGWSGAVAAKSVNKYNAAQDALNDILGKYSP